MHLDLYDAIPIACFTPSAFYVKAEPPLAVSSKLCFRKLREQIPNMCEYAGIRRRIGTRRPADRSLVDVDDLVDMLDPLDLLVLARFLLAAIHFFCNGLI